jgi:hypothetical protein
MELYHMCSLPPWAQRAARPRGGLGCLLLCSVTIAERGALERERYSRTARCFRDVMSVIMVRLTWTLGSSPKCPDSCDEPVNPAEGSASLVLTPEVGKVIRAGNRRTNTRFRREHLHSASALSVGGCGRIKQTPSRCP